MGAGVIKRRAFALSDASEEFYDKETGSLTIELFAASLDPFRVAPEGQIPMPWPHELLASSVQDLFKAIEGQTIDILHSCGIGVETMVAKLISPKLLYKAAETIIVYSSDTVTDTWKAAATRIRLLVDRETQRQNLATEVSVEIRNWNRMYRDYSSAVHFDTPAQQLLQSMHNRAEELAEEHCINLSSISFHMRGPLNREIERVPTDIISCRPMTKFRWNDAYNQVLEGLEEFIHPDTIDFQVELMPGCTMLC